jgi:hypothetical protein
VINGYIAIPLTPRRNSAYRMLSNIHAACSVPPSTMQ